MDETIKSQTSTEYLILLAVGIIVALLVVKVLTTQSGATTSASEQADVAALERMPIGISAFDFSLRGVNLEVVNHMAKRVVINGITINGTNLNSHQFPFSILPHETVIVHSYTMLMAKDQGYSYNLSIDYTDTELNINQIQYRSDLMLDGKSNDVDYYIDEEEDLARDLVGLWRFDESSWSGVADEVEDVSVKKNHGQGQGDATITASGAIDNAGTFDGTGDYVNIASSSSLNFDDTKYYSWSAWIYPGAVNFPIVSKKGGTKSGYTIYLEGSKFCINDNDPAATESCTTETVTLNTWTHVAINYSSETLSLYINGDAKKTSTIAGFADDTNGAVKIGQADATFDFTTVYANGRIDEVAIWNRTLTGEEISSIYQRGLASLNE
jgi:hypothetical protein